jgi:bifunctional non-homologous end joining protein LigD
MAKANVTMLEVEGREVRLSNPDKVYFPKPGWTKLDIARYYVDAAEAALIHVRERPTVMKRFVNGIMEDPIWQKRVPKNIPEWLQTATVAFPSGRTAEELVANDAAHFVWAVNLGVIDFNPWPARRADLDHPDELRVDLDPTPGIGWDDVRRTALVVRDVLADHGLEGYPKTSGSKGIHVNVRIEPRWDFLEVRRAALAMAREVERRAPDLATTKWWKEERHGVFVDYNQNARDRTVASCYSVRPTPDARVSCALRWAEVPDVEPADLRLDTVPDRLGEVGDPGADIDERPGSLEALLELARRDEEEGLGDAPWPPHFPKQKDEPKRVQPSRDRDRPKQRGRAGDPQPGGPPEGVPGGLQRGFGAKPRTGQGYEQEFDEGSGSKEPAAKKKPAARKKATTSKKKATTGKRKAAATSKRKS